MKTMGKFIQETFPTFEERVKRWEISGLLEGIDNQQTKELIAMAYESTAIYFGMPNGQNYSYEFKNITIPIVRRIFKNTDKNFTTESLTKTIVKLINDLSIEYNKNIENFKNSDIKNGIDKEAEFCKNYSENYIL